MAHELKVPAVGESVQEVQIGQWLKKEGEWIAQDENVVEIETDKASVELPAPVAGVLSKIVKQEGEGAQVGDVIGYLEPSDEPPDESDAKQTKRKSAPAQEQADESDEADDEPSKKSKKKSTDKKSSEKKQSDEKKSNGKQTQDEPRVMPAAERLLAKHDLEPKDVKATGPGGRLLKEDVEAYLEQQAEESKSADEPKTKEEQKSPQKEEAPSRSAAPASASAAEREEERVPMSLIRRRIAERLVEAQQNAALLTTFNEIDMTEVKALRARHGEAFQRKYEVKLGFMSFFVKASIEALKQYPAVNAEIDGREIVYRNYFDIGIAVGGGRGLVVPIVRNAERMSFAEIERTIGELADRAQQNKLKPDELEGGTFTISNGGVYGSLLSTPIVNPPQSGVLGLHAIQDRPVAREGQIIIRPMMYVALTYDHRIVDGREAVSFLRHIKLLLEEPSRMILEI